LSRYKKIQGQLQDRGAFETIAHYLTLLEEAFLIAPLKKYARTQTRQRAAPPKRIALNNALLAVMRSTGRVSQQTDPATFGAHVENACLALAWNTGHPVTYWREEPNEIDAVILLEFSQSHRELTPVLVTDERGLSVAKQAGICGITWHDYLFEQLKPEA
jgi:predicted AAA+ superfamily ATPase